MMRHSNSKPDNQRARAEARGRKGEWLAAWYLRFKLFSIVDKRVKTPGGEIDIVARRGNLIIFVEVKMRKSKSAMGEALEAVNQARIIKAASFYLARNPKLNHKTLRFDVIFIAPFTWPTHLKGAFETN